MIGRIVVACGAAVCFFAAPIMAQINDPSIKPENIEMLPAKTPVLEYVLAGGFLLAALAIGFMPSKRAMDPTKKLRSSQG